MGAVIATPLLWPNNFSSPPPPPPNPPPNPSPPPPAPEFLKADTCDLHNGGGSSWHVESGYGRVPEARIECFMRELDYYDQFTAYPVCWSRDCCHGFVMKRDWTKWLCMTDDLTEELDEDVKVGGRFANGGVAEMGTRLR